MSDEKLETLQLTAEQAKKIGHDLIDGLINCHNEGEWMSLTLNITAGPKEGPIAVMCFAPGTIKEVALGIQNTVSEALLNRNK